MAKDENTRLPSDSVVEAAERMRSMAAHEIICGLPVEDFSEDDWLNLAKAALAAQPRDDVRELLREAANALGDACLSVHDELLDRIDAALSQTDEQPDTDKKE